MRPGSGLLLLTSFILLAVVACGAAATPKPLPMAARVIGRGKFKGYTPGQRLTFATPESWVGAQGRLSADQRKTVITRLRSEGFKMDLTEFLAGPQGPKTGVSAVMQLGSAASAGAELAAQLRSSQAQGAETFHLKAIPRATGYRFINPESGGENILFADGPFLYLLGYGWFGATHNPNHSTLIDAATALYARVHGHPAR